MTQFSLFGAEAADPGLDDLEGLLVGGGKWVRSGQAARLSVVVADRWRADALAAAFGQRGVAADPMSSDGDAVVPAASGFGVRTAFAAGLLPSATRWTRGANQGVPAGFVLGAGGLRLWTIAAGRRDDAGFLLATVAPDEPLHQVAGAALSRLGVAAVSLARSRSGRGGAGWRVTSARRLRRLAELVGPPPDGAGEDWPDAVVG